MDCLSNTISNFPVPNLNPDRIKELGPLKSRVKKMPIRVPKPVPCEPVKHVPIKVTTELTKKYEPVMPIEAPKSVPPEPGKQAPIKVDTELTKKYEPVIDPKIEIKKESIETQKLVQSKNTSIVQASEVDNKRNLSIQTGVNVAGVVTGVTGVCGIIEIALSKNKKRSLCKVLPGIGVTFISGVPIWATVGFILLARELGGRLYDMMTSVQEQSSYSYSDDDSKVEDDQIKSDEDKEKRLIPVYKKTGGKEHTKNPSKSKKDKHQKGQARKQADQRRKEERRKKQDDSSSSSSDSSSEEDEDEKDEKKKK